MATSFPYGYIIALTSPFLYAASSRHLRKRTIVTIMELRRPTALRKLLFCIITSLSGKIEYIHVNAVNDTMHLVTPLVLSAS